MIDRVLNFVRNQAEQSLRRELGEPTKDQHLVHSRIIGDNGQVDIQSTLGMAVVRIEEDRIFPNRTRARPVDERLHYTAGEMALSLHVLFAPAPQEDYTGMLRALSALTLWAQGNRSFRREQYPELAENDIARLTLEFETLSYEVQNHIWGSLGGRYLPSIVLLIRFVPIRPHKVDQVGAPISELAHVPQLDPEEASP